MAYILNKAFISQLPHNEVKRLALFLNPCDAWNRAQLVFAWAIKLGDVGRDTNREKVIGALRSKGIS